MTLHRLVELARLIGQVRSRLPNRLLTQSREEFNQRQGWHEIAEKSSEIVSLGAPRTSGPNPGSCVARRPYFDSDLSFTRVSTAIQFTSHVLPPSSENDCSKRHESAVMSDQIFRTRMLLPLNGS